MKFTSGSSENKKLMGTLGVEIVMQIKDKLYFKLHFVKYVVHVRT